MELATVAHAGGTTAAIRQDDGWRALPAADLSRLLATVPVDGLPALAGDRLADVRLLRPLPTPAKVVCCGLNYGDHIAETGRTRPTHPTLFPKHADTLLGPDEDLELPAGLQVDWEAELAVVVGRPLRSADRDEAAAAILGYTVANDVSVRDWQYRTGEWFQGKAWDATTPTGPVVVTADVLDPRAGLDVVCRVNGTEVQRGSTATLVFDAADLLAYTSTFTALRPGDLVLTGTPAGVGVARDPQWFLADGDVLETEVAGIGRLRNTVRLLDRPHRTAPHRTDARSPDVARAR